MNRAKEEHDNLRAALGRSLEAGETETALRMCLGLWQFWTDCGYVTEGRRWLERAFERAGDVPAALRADALRARGNMAWYQGDNTVARGYHEESLALCRELNDKVGIGFCLNCLANIASGEGNYALARRQYEESLALAEELGRQSGIVVTKGNLGVLAGNQGDSALARRYIEEALATARELGHEGEPFITWLLLNLGGVMRRQGDNVQAQACLEESEAHCREVGFLQGLAQALTERGRLAIQQSDHVRARECLHEVLTILQEEEAKLEIAIALAAFASLAAAQSDTARAARLFSAAEALFEAIAVVIPPIERDEIDCYLAPIRKALDPEVFDALWAEGRAMSWEEAVEVALGE